jgi:hypothetical protein
MIADCGLRIADPERKWGDARRPLLIVLLLFLLIPHSGCNPPQAAAPDPAAQRVGRDDRPHEADQAIVPNPQSAMLSPPAATGGRNPQVPAGFTPVKIGILPLTELSGPSDASQRAKLSVFVALLDAFGSQIKAPGVLRFELYEHIPRSAQSKGQRLTLWPDIDLTSPAPNNKYWRDFLRAYEFVLDTQATRDKTYILEVTCMCPDGRRLSGEYVLKNSP